MKKTGKSIFWGIVIVIGAILLLIDGLKLFSFGSYGLTPFKLFAALITLSWFLYELFRFKITRIFIPLALFFFSIESTLAYFLGIEGGNIISNWKVIVVAILLSIGLKLLLPREGGIFWDGHSNKLGTSTIYFDAADLSDANMRDIVGDVSVYFVNKEAYSGDGEIEIRDVLGKVTVHVPKEWLIKTDVRDKVGRIRIPRQKDGVYEKKLTLNVRDVVGDIKVVFE